MRKIMGLAFLAIALTTPSLVTAAGWGLRGGVTFDPDQIHVGAHVNAGELFNNGYFLPNAEIGFGDDLTLIALNPELVYRFDHRTRSRWGFYVGGGLGINIVNWDHDDDFPGDDGHDHSDTDLGLNFLGGMFRQLSSGNEFFFELKIGAVDSPDAKITIGFTFY
ncbi:MAG TPA: hypothetical protein PLL30_00890 [Candidatus Krumholzibacteria bacterium]|nr:hypothetical protein [Candidatus Krumholzibacteria bacterium]HPD70317.1 hypothetical protein [Candidatus Krumholzibacteria bacterium]HRY39983.1 hypothetical protein [Candidatus Krumholzibacteria bacterium]